MISKLELQNWINEYLQGTEYELITLNVSAGNDILIEVDRLAGVDVDFCAELNRFLVEKLEAYLQQCSTDGHRQSDRAELFTREGKRDLDYSLEVGSVSLTDPFKTKMQYEKNLGQGESGGRGQEAQRDADSHPHLALQRTQICEI